MKPPTVPPIKCQGIKTKLIPAIRAVVPKLIEGRWIEPFCGSCAVLFNIRPVRALVSDTNKHIVRFYTDLQSGSVTPGMVYDFLRENGELLKIKGEGHYYEVREEFNRSGSSLAFLFLNRSCFNGVMRFNRKGGFNVPFCRKPTRFAQAYVTKIMNQLKTCVSLLKDHDWIFRTNSFQVALGEARENDVVYVDPPYAGRHTDYYNSWSEVDERELAVLLKKLPCSFVLSTWFKNEFRTNPIVEREWLDSRYTINTKEHFYHVGPSEDLRHPMLEALITNYRSTIPDAPAKHSVSGLFDSLDEVVGASSIL